MIEDQEDRLVAMVQDAGQTWDLSPKDRRAIGAALFAVSALRAEVEKWKTRAEFAEHELSDAFGPPATIGPTEGEASRIVDSLRERLAQARDAEDVLLEAILLIRRGPFARQVIDIAKDALHDYAAMVGEGRKCTCDNVQYFGVHLRECPAWRIGE